MQSLKKIKTIYIYSLLVLAVLVLSVLREPLFFTAPRIWAEEGTIHVASILSNGIWASLIKPHLGYFSLFNNYVVAFGIGLFGIEKLPYVTTIASFFIILMTAFAPLILSSKYWDTDLKKVLIVSFTIFVGKEEIWLNVINSQFYFCVFSCFLLLSDKNKISGWRFWYVIFMVLNGALTGITTVALLPFYFYGFIKEKHTNTLEHIILYTLFFGALIQILSLFFMTSVGSLNRFDLLNLKNFPIGFYKSLMSYPKGSSLIKILFFLFIVLALLKSKEKIKTISFMPLLIAVYISGLFTFLSLGMNGGGRYAFAPSVLVFLFLINTVPQINYNKFKNILLILTIIIFIMSMKTFFDTKGAYDPSWVRYSVSNISFDFDGNGTIKIFPQGKGTNWAISIKKSDLERYK